MKINRFLKIKLKINDTKLTFNLNIKCLAQRTQKFGQSKFT